MKMKKALTHKNALLKNAQANAEGNFFKRVYFSPAQEEIQIIFSNASKKIKTPDTQARQKSTRQMTEIDDIKMVVTHDRQERQPITAPPM